MDDNGDKYSCRGDDMKDKKQVADEFRNKPAGIIFPKAANEIQKGNCPTCGKPVGEFTDALSKREYGISGMCQKCQDSVFGGDE